MDSFILTTFTAIGNDEDDDSIVSFLKGYRVPPCRCRCLQSPVYLCSSHGFCSRLTGSLPFLRKIVGGVNGGRGNLTQVHGTLCPPYEGLDQLSKTV